MSVVDLSPNLYSGDLRLRFEATVSSGPVALPRKWPLGCGGAANAFLSLVGPSMGRPTGGGPPAPSGADRPYRHPMTIGPEAMNLDWGDHRKGRWNRLCVEMLGHQAYVPALTSLLNLDWRHSTNAKEIPEDDLRTGLYAYVWPLITELKPRLVCALTNHVWEIMRPKVASLRVPFGPCPMQLAREPIVFRLKGAGFPSLFVKPHNHPSRFLKNTEIAELGRACRWFLAEASQ
jgi:hypothetical protein